MGKKPEQAKHQVFVVFRSEGEPDIKMPWTEYKAKELRHFAAMHCSEDPALRHDGKKQLQAVAQELHDLQMELFLERLKNEESQKACSLGGQMTAASRWGNRWGEENEVQRIVAKLAAATDQWGGIMNAKDLWPLFYSELEQAQLLPEEIGGAETTDESIIRWKGNPTGIMLKTFRNLLATARGMNKK